MIGRAAIGALLACAIVLIAHRSRALDRTGAYAAVLIGTASAIAGWDWALLLIAFFLSSSALSRIGVDIKHRASQDILEKGSERDAQQVIANGGVFALAALVDALTASPIAHVAGAGAIAAAMADTWATEIGMVSKARPRHVITGRTVPAGTSGATTSAGTAGMVLGAGFAALCAFAVGWPVIAIAAAFGGGVVGASVDTVVGATIQARRRCASCGVLTERVRHTCGAHTAHAGGIEWLGNDMVNLLATCTGALTGILLFVAATAR